MTNGKIERFGEEDARDGRESCNPLIYIYIYKNRIGNVKFGSRTQLYLFIVYFITLLLFLSTTAFACQLPDTPL
jgi:hypothetical protein